MGLGTDVGIHRDGSLLDFGTLLAVGLVDEMKTMGAASLLLQRAHCGTCAETWGWMFLRVGVTDCAYPR